MTKNNGILKPISIGKSPIKIWYASTASHFTILLSFLSSFFIMFLCYILTHLACVFIRWKCTIKNCYKNDVKILWEVLVLTTLTSIQRRRQESWSWISNASLTLQSNLSSLVFRIMTSSHLNPALQFSAWRGIPEASHFSSVTNFWC